MIFSATSCIIGTSAIRSPRFLSLEIFSLEMTNRILLLSQSLFHPVYPFFASRTYLFGRSCSVAQTRSMIAGTGLQLFFLYNTETDAALAVRSFDHFSI